ncbi:MAG: ferrous iron transporter B, partial [Oligoflexia bacterium]|nr:ferrous iron transporter B [Oligoflexia bacterium]
MSSELQQPISGDKVPALEILVAGNPNCGKTTLFNALTGLHYKVANYPGVTVEKKSGQITLKNGQSIPISDLPGIYCISHASLDEKIASDALLEAADNNSAFMIIAVVDASNLERNLYLTSQIIDLGLPMLVALNMVDVAEKNGISIRDELLSATLGVPVVRTVARQGNGTQQLKVELSAAIQKASTAHKTFAWLPEDSPIRERAQALGSHTHPQASAERKLMQGLMLLSDSIAVKDKSLREHVLAARNSLQEVGIDCSSFDATLRYRWINDIVRRCCVVSDPKRRRLSERIDSIITHRIWGSLFFLALMAFIFQALFLWASLPMDLIDSAVSWLGRSIGALLPEGILKSLIVDGVVAGVGSVLVFVP